MPDHNLNDILARAEAARLRDGWPAAGGVLQGELELLLRDYDRLRLQHQDHIELRCRCGRAAWVPRTMQKDLLRGRLPDPSCIDCLLAAPEPQESGADS